jgi:hypothetical protein
LESADGLPPLIQPTHKEFVICLIRIGYKFIENAVDKAIDPEKRSIHQSVMNGIFLTIASGWQTKLQNVGDQAAERGRS